MDLLVFILVDFVGLWNRGDKAGNLLDWFHTFLGV